MIDYLELLTDLLYELLEIWPLFLAIYVGVIINSLQSRKQSHGKGKGRSKRR